MSWLVPCCIGRLRAIKPVVAVGEAVAEGSLWQRASISPAWGLLLSHLLPAPAAGLANSLRSCPSLHESQPRSSALVQEISLIRGEQNASPAWRAAGPHST